MFPVDRRPLEAHTIAPLVLDPLGSHQDFEFVTVPVCKTRTKEPQLCYSYSQQDFAAGDSRYHQDNVAELRGPYYYQQPPHVPPYSLLSLPAPSPSPRLESGVRPLVSQYAPPRMDLQHCKNEEQVCLHKNVLLNMAGRRWGSDLHLQMDREEGTQQQPGSAMRSGRGNCNPCVIPFVATTHLTKPQPQQESHRLLHSKYSDQSLCSPVRDYLTDDSVVSFVTERRVSPLNISSTPPSSIQSAPYSSYAKSHPGHAVGSQTDFFKSPLEEKFLFRETILLGCSEMTKWASVLNFPPDMVTTSTLIKNKTKQSRAQNICSSIGEDVNSQVIINEYLKVFLKVADCWLEARNCFGLTDNCKSKICQLNSPDISQDYLEWQHTSRRLLGRILDGVGRVLQQTLIESCLSTTDNPCRCCEPVWRLERRLRHSATCLPKHSGTPVQDRRSEIAKWTVSDAANTTSYCTNTTRILGQAKPPDFLPCFAERQTIKLADIPQHKITLLSQIEPPYHRKEDNVCPSADISAWFAYKNGYQFQCGDSGSNGLRFAGQVPGIHVENIMRTQSGNQCHPINDTSHDSSDDLQPKFYLNPGSYNVDRQNVPNTKMANNVNKAKKTCCEDKETPLGYIVPHGHRDQSYSGQNKPNIKIAKKENISITDLPLKPDGHWKDIINQKINDETYTETNTCSTAENCEILKSKKTDEWLLRKLLKSDVLKPLTDNPNPKSPTKNEKLEQESASRELVLAPREKDGKDRKDSIASDKSSCGADDNTNASPCSGTSKTPGKNSKINKNMWHNSKRRRPMSQQTTQKLEDIVMELYRQDISEYILHAVKTSQVADYYKVVRYPIFLETISNKTKNRTYETVEQFIHDCRRLVFNSILYYEKNKIEAEKINKFSDILEKILREKLDNCNFWNHITGDPSETHFYPELRYSSGAGTTAKKKCKPAKFLLCKDEK